MYPLIMAPFFRHGSDTPWGGSMLRDLFMKDSPDEMTGEALEVSALEGRESVVLNGAFAGQTLTSMIKRWGRELTGDIKGEFPLLIKLLDAKELLSVQVHPDDAYAGANEGGKLGKTEAWVVLSCEPGAKLAYGIDTKGRDLSEMVAAGDIEDALNWVSVRPGDVLYIPAGTVHALGGGIQCYEVQQSSDVTYRFWDWGRVGKDGNPRELHTEKALDVTNAGEILPKCEGATVLCRGGSITYYIADENFELARLNVSGKMPLMAGRMHMLTPMGPCRIVWPEGEMDVMPMTTVLVPAGLEGVVVEGDLKVLMSSTSDREYLKNELGYRAENVAGLVK